MITQHKNPLALAAEGLKALPVQRGHSFFCLRIMKSIPQRKNSFWPVLIDQVANGLQR